MPLHTMIRFVNFRMIIHDLDTGFLTWSRVPSAASERAVRRIAPQLWSVKATESLGVKRLRRQRTSPLSLASSPWQKSGNSEKWFATR
jgi:hypothetical protein